MGAIALAVLFNPILGRAFQAGDRQVHLNGQYLEVTWDTLTRAPQSITAVGSDLLEVKDISRLTRREINDIGALLVGKYGALLKVRPDQLVLRKAEKTDGIWRVCYQQTAGGVAVFDSSLVFTIDSEGHIKSLGAILYPDARPAGYAKIRRGKALKAAHGSLLESEKREYRLDGEAVAIYPERKAGAIDYLHVYVFNLFPRNAASVANVTGGYAVLVDTRTGRVIRARNPAMAVPASHEAPESPFQ